MSENNILLSTGNHSGSMQIWKIDTSDINFISELCDGHTVI